MPGEGAVEKGGSLELSGEGEGGGRSGHREVLKNLGSLPGKCEKECGGNRSLGQVGCWTRRLLSQAEFDLEIRPRTFPHLQVRYLTFSAHTDAKGILQLVRQCGPPRSVVLVHGDRARMEFMRDKIRK